MMYYDTTIEIDEFEVLEDISDKYIIEEMDRRNLNNCKDIQEMDEDQFAEYIHSLDTPTVKRMFDIIMNSHHYGSLDLF